MAAKSIIEVDLDDTKFKQFQSAFAKYQEALGKMPADWQKVGKASNATLEKMMKQAEKGLNFQEAFRQSVISTGRAMDTLGRGTATVARNIASATTQLLKWASITTAFGGLLGAGGLFGIDRLAQGASNTRRQAQGLGISAGELKAAKVNYQRYLDVESTLGNIQSSQYDVSKRWAFSALGVNPNGKDSAELLTEMLPKIVEQFKAGGSTQQGAEARGLTNFVDMPTLIRLSKLNPEELAAASRAYARDKKNLDVSDAQLRNWQDFNVQLARAGEGIENTFVRGLIPLAGPLSKLSESVEKAVESFLKNPKMGEWIDDFGKNIEKMAKYMQSDEFQKGVKNFVDDVVDMARAIHKGLEWLGVLNDHTTPKPTPADQAKTKAAIDRHVWARNHPGQSILDHMFGVPKAGNNNFGNIRTKDLQSFRSYNTALEGVAAADANLRAYNRKYGDDTIQAIISRWAPKKDHNDTDKYIRDVANQTGLDPTDHLDINDPTVRKMLLSAIFKKEGRAARQGVNTDPLLDQYFGRNGGNVQAGSTVNININNNTGGSAIVTANALAR